MAGAGKHLSGIRVLDLSSMIVGPACTVRLADYGAAVTKIESPEGDLMRSLGGPSPTGQHSGSYIHFNRGKRSVCLDLKRAEAREALLLLVEQSDVFVSNIRPAALEKLGLSTVALRGRNPDIICCLITGFGPGGPYRGLPAYDSVLQGASGLAGLFERRDGAPIYVPMLICDHIVGEIAAGAILAALYERRCGGEAADIEIPMFETMASFVLQEHLGPRTFEPALGPVGDGRILSRWNRPIETADGWLSLTTNTDAQTQAFLRAIGREDLMDDSRFRTNADRVANADAWFGFRKDALKNRTTAEWLAIFGELDVPAMPCHTLGTVVDDPHLQAVGLMHASRHPTEGMIRSLRSTVLHNGNAPEIAPPAQPIGWDTREVLAEAGLGRQEIDRLFEIGAARSSKTVEAVAEAS